METVNELNRQIADAAARGEKFYGSEAMLGAPDIARIGLSYHPGGEVTNTSLENKSWLGKTTFRLPNRQTLKFGLRHTDSIFGEIMPSRMAEGMGQTAFLQYRLFMEARRQPLDRFRCVIVDDPYQIQNQYRRRFAR